MIQKGCCYTEYFSENYGTAKVKTFVLYKNSKNKTFNANLFLWVEGGEGAREITRNNKAHSLHYLLFYWRITDKKRGKVGCDCFIRAWYSFIIFDLFVIFPFFITRNESSAIVNKSGTAIKLICCLQ